MGLVKHHWRPRRTAKTEAAGGLTWLRADEMLPLGPGWRGLLP